MTAETKQDKTGQMKKPTDLISGKRLNIARDMRGKTWQELAKELTEIASRKGSKKIEFEVNRVQKWVLRGIPKGRLFFVAKYFKVEEWVFTDERLSDEDFKRIIYEPALMDQLKPGSQINASALQPSKDSKDINPQNAPITITSKELQLAESPNKINLPSVVDRQVVLKDKEEDSSETLDMIFQLPFLLIIFILIAVFFVGISYQALRFLIHNLF
jgi:hypothetical protein